VGRTVTEKHEHGEFICEWVDEVPPLGEDRKTIVAPLTSLESLKRQLDEVVGQARAEMFGLMAVVLSALAEEYGDDVWEVAGKTMYDIGYQRGQEFAQTMKIDPKDARSVGRIFDLEDTGIGIKGEWVETGKRRVVKREFCCPLGPMSAVCPEICTRLFDSVEKGTFDAIGVKGKLSYPKLMGKGDPYCEVVLELEE
jgi:predicted hydrocarbon binding protein